MTLTTLSKVFTSKNRSLFDPFFIRFSTFAPEPLIEATFGARSADLRPKGRFVVHLRISRGAKMDPRISTCRQERIQRGMTPSEGKRPGSDPAPHRTTLQNCFLLYFLNFWRIWNRCWVYFLRCSLLFGRFCIDFTTSQTKQPLNPGPAECA